jgi:AraC family transcriptional regulator, arabinose operon regulatory protein
MPPESPSPVVRRISAGRFDEGPGYHTYRSRGTTDWLIIHTVGGRGRFGNGTVEIPALPGDTTLLRPGVVHDYGVEPTLLQWSIVFAHFHPRADWAALLDWPQPIPGVMQVHSAGEVERRLAAHLEEAARLSRGALPNREQFGLNALEAALLWCDTQNSRQHSLDERVLRALDYIDTHLGETLSVATIARAVALSESRFAHLFADQVGMSPSRYVESQRLNSAMQLLELTARPVNVIAAQVGFTDPLYFSTRFRRHTGRSPLQFREQAAPSSGG